MRSEAWVAALVNWHDVTLGGLLALVAVLVAAAWVLRHEERYSQIRIGFFIERNDAKRETPDEWDHLPPEFEAWLLDYLTANPPIFEEGEPQ